MPRQLCLRLVDVLGKHRFDDLRGERLTDSLDPGPREADLDAPRRHVRVFFLADKVEFGRPDVGVAGELPHLVHRRPVADRVVDRRLRRKSRRRNFSSSYPFFPADRPVFHGFHGLRRLWRESQSASSPHFLPPPCLVSSGFLLTSLSPKPLIFGLFPHDRLPLPWDQTAPRTSLGG